MKPKKQKLSGQDIRPFFQKSGSSGSSSLPTESSQPGGTKPSEPDGTKPSEPDGTKPSEPDGTKPSEPDGTKLSEPDGTKLSEPDGTKPSEPDGTKLSEPDGTKLSEPAGATGSQNFKFNQRRVKEEKDADTTGEHFHSFTVKFSPTDNNKYTIACDQPRTVLEAIKSSENYSKRMQKCLDENIVIQLGKADKTSIVATHFPCSCVKDGESLIITCELEQVEAAQDQQHKPVQSRDKYSVFYIDTVGGLFTKQKRLFRNNALKQFKYLCVCGEKGMTVEEALKLDGRFIDDLSNFTLSDNQNPNRLIECTQKVDILDKKKFKIRLPRNKRKSDEKQQQNCAASDNSKKKSDTTAVLDLVQQKGISVKTAVAQGDYNIEEIYEKLREQSPALRELMESRFPGDSYQKALDVRKENFGKIQQAFSEVHRVRELIKLGESVCKVVVQNVQGTVFVLFDNFILTNAHLFTNCVEGQKLRDGIKVFVLFNYEAPEPNTNYYYFQLANSFVCYSEGELDYAILEINPEGQRANQATQTKKIKMPPGLLKKFGPMPQNGEACLIGHPAGGLKKMDPTCIIEKENRGKAVNDHLHPFKDSIFILHSISHLIREQGIENIMVGGYKAEKVATYNTFMYHGASGSPVFDAHCEVFGLHTAGYTYGHPNHKESVIEFAQPVLTIFKHFVSILKEDGNGDLLRRVKKEAKGNPHLERVLSTLGIGNDDPSDSNEPSADPDEPTADPDEPTADPDEPTADPDEASADPDEPTADPDEASADPDEPTADPDEPTADPDEPSADPDEPMQIE